MAHFIKRVLDQREAPSSILRTWNPSAGEAEACGSLGRAGQPVRPDLEGSQLVRVPVTLRNCTRGVHTYAYAHTCILCSSVHSVWFCLVHHVIPPPREATSEAGPGQGSRNVGLQTMPADTDGVKLRSLNYAPPTLPPPRLQLREGLQRGDQGKACCPLCSHCF